MNVPETVGEVGIGNVKYALHTFFFSKLVAAIRRTNSTPTLSAVISPERLVYISLAGGRILVGVLEPTQRTEIDLEVPLYIRIPGGQDLFANVLHNFLNVDSSNINEFRCYIPLRNGNVLMAFLEHNLHGLNYPVGAEVFLRLPNSTRLSGLLRLGEGHRPSWLPLL